eukprot:gene6402-8813_t
MELFGFGSYSDLATPIGLQIKSATESLLIGPDWSKNLDICDEISRAKDGPEQSVRAFYRRLQDNDFNTVYLTLILMETCVKNCGTNFARCVDRSIMDEMSNLAKGSKGEKNSFESLRLIQQWGRAYESKKSSLPIFFETFVNLKSKGFQFPKEEENTAAIFEPVDYNKPPRTVPAPPKKEETIDNSKGDLAVKNESEFEKLRKDLQVVMEKVLLCREMLLESPGIDQDEILADVIGFLEACRDRIVLDSYHRSIDL